MKIVEQGYNKIADAYLQQRDQFRSTLYIENLNKLLKHNSLILDIGCGAGKPIDEFFIRKGHKIIGIDISKRQVAIARKLFPQGRFEVKDMSKLRMKEYKVDAVVSFYAIFHIPRELHRELFQKIRSFLPKGGFLLVTMGASEHEGLEKDFHGASMFWSHYSADKNRKMIEDAGFEVISDSIDASGGEKHQIILARASKITQGYEKVG